MKIEVKKKLLKTLTGFSWAVVAIIFFWFGKKLIEIFRYETTNDAQVNAYINPIVSRVGGYITEIYYTDFQTVKKGDTLLVIDNREYISDAQQIKADMQKQGAEINAMKSQEYTLQTEANEAKSIIDGIKAEVWKQELEYKRYQELYNRKSSTAQQLEKIKAQLDVYKSELKKAEYHYQVALSKINDIRANEKVVLAEKKRLNEIHTRKNIDVGYTVITAPYNGRLGKRTVEIGQMIKMGDHLGYIVNDETPKWIIANFKETQIENLKINDHVSFVADAFPNIEYKGKIVAFAPGTGSVFSLLPTDNATGNFVKIVQRIPVKIEIINNNKREVSKLQAGMNVEVTVKE